MTIIQYLPQWLRNKWQKPAPQRTRNRRMKDRQILPMVPIARHVPIRFQDDPRPRECHIYWRL